MTIIDQLDQTVTTAVLGDDNSVAHISLLEQFYAILITRLAQPAVYSQLLRADQDLPIQSTTSSTLFEQLWAIVSLRQLLIDELAATHHVDPQATESLLINAAPLAYQELKILANGQFLPAFLQAQQLSVRSYLPVWAEEVILPINAVSNEMGLNKDTLINNIEVTDANANANVMSESVRETQTIPEQAFVTDKLSIDPLESTEVKNDKLLLDEEPLLTDTIDALHANPSDYYDAGISESRLNVRTRNRRNDLMVRVLILAGALAAIGLVWALVIQPNYMTPTAPVVTSPVVITPVSEPVAKVSIPAELVVGVDDSGSLYSCTATVGDTEFQNALKQALSMSFGEQVSICELRVRQGVANSLSSINVETLPSIFTLLRSVPFARLQLQQDTLNLEAPDDTLLQRLLIDMRTLVPAIAITSAAPLPLDNSNGLSDDANNDMSMMNGRNNEFTNEKIPLDNTYDSTYPNNNNLSRNQNYQPSDDNTNDIIEVAPPRNNSDNSFNSNANNNRAFTTPAGSMSASEVNDLANTTIVAEKLRNERPVDKNLIQDR
ncbi:hypothetical protein [Psychrobacter sp. P11G5]|uniref:hypothetical protein n=1 Tax=Psychrobacter sp. P11G5 TaxID=1699624 RepID=UPI00078B438A|nr:hypothetical protein [Psychrobacter sp. P11G5]AMN66606.1 hypothetical protein AK825_01780 [Psychrobacter sp. P11G5]